MSRLLLITAATAALGGAALVASQTSVAATTKTVTVRFSGGHVTDARDSGRPVVLIAAALGVPTEVFRKAFSGVTPAGAGEAPDPAQVQRNKAALLQVLAPYGVTNERLDTVSNYYRYVESEGELWTHTAAQATATVKDGKLVAVHLVSGGAGYSSTPRATVPGFGSARVKLAYGTTLTTNGRVATLRLSR